MFESLPLKNITLKNSFIRSATSERVSSGGYPDIELLGNLYRRLAEGEAGTILTGFCFVSPEGQSSPTQNGLHEDGLIPVWQSIIEKSRAQEFNTKIFAQIVHGGRQITFPTKLPNLVPSETSIPVSVNSFRVMNKKDIEGVREAFVRAAERAVQAGFDGVQIHCAHGYLLNEFLSPAINKRNDEYGGNTKNRTRLLIEIFSDIRASYPDIPLAVKINGCDYIKNGLVPEETSEIISLIKDFSLAFYEVSGWMWEGDDSKAPSRKKDPKIPAEEGYYQNETLSLQKDHPDEFFALCGGIRSMNFCRHISKNIQLLSMSRPFISEPNLVKLFMESKKSRVRCISCNMCVTRGPEKGLECIYFNNKRMNSN